jgi:rhodanese-related sulfurtransferase
MKHAPGFLKIVGDAKSRIREIGADELVRRREEGEDLLLVDVREDREWERGRLPGAVHCGKGVLERDIEGICAEPSRTIVLYCGGGFRSALSADALQKMGYTEVFSLAGGWREWTEAGRPVES